MSSLPILERSIAFFRPHHQELRQRLTRAFAGIAICSIVAYLFSEQLTQQFIAPLFSASPLVSKLVYTNLPEAFFSYMKLSLLIGIGVSYPYTLFQIWMFIAPGLRKSEKKVGMIVVFWGTLLFVCGGTFSFFIVLPRMLHYFMSYAGPNLEPLPKFGMYLTFVARTILTFGLAFEVPFLMVMAGKANFITADRFREKRVYFYIAIVTLAFLLTAGDIMGCALLALPLFGLYEAGIILTKIFVRKKKEIEETEEDQ